MIPLVFVALLLNAWAQAAKMETTLLGFQFGNREAEADLSVVLFLDSVLLMIYHLFGRHNRLPCHHARLTTWGGRLTAMVFSLRGSVSVESNRDVRSVKRTVFLGSFVCCCCQNCGELCSFHELLDDRFFKTLKESSFKVC